MEKKEMKLSISLMVSNSIDTIRKCMDSLVPVLERIPSELIIVDTGGSDGSIEVAKEYATKIVPFAWCNDFAKARNAGLKEAKGEWFLFLDDDEWFEDVEEIVSFFQKGEYKEYNSASYLIRNYFDKEGSNWEDVRSCRLIRKTPDLQFESPIHEVLVPIFGPEKTLNSYVHHYGYVFDTREERIKHAKRNISILEEVLSRESLDIRLMVQLAQEYRTIDEYDKSQEISLNTIKVIESMDEKTEQIIKFAGWSMVNVLFMEREKKCYENLYEYGREFLCIPWINNITKNNLSNLLIEVCYLQENIEGILNYWKLYEDTYFLLNSDANRIRNEAILNQDETLKPILYLSSCFLCYKICMLYSKEGPAENFMEKMVYNGLKEYPHMLKEVTAFIKEVVDKNPGLLVTCRNCLQKILMG